MNEYNLALKVSVTTIILNVLLAVFKIFAGIVGSSNAIFADGIHTMSDVFTTLVVLVGLKIASKEADENHPYGHEKYESIFAKILSIILLLTGIYIGYEGISLLVSKDFTSPGRIALWAAFISIIVKELMYRYTLKTAKEIKSISMEADAWHHRSDAFSSIGTLVGVIGSRLGFPALDPIAAIIVGLMIIKVGVDLYLKSVKELVDESADEETIDKIIKKVYEIEGVEGIRNLRTRIFGNRIYVDIDIYVDGEITVRSGHEIAEKVHNKLEREITDIKHCMVHVDPIKVQ